MKKRNGKGKVKGSVLFTVVTVMMVMVVFLMSTLILTASSQKRTYYTYYQKQAQFACQSALDVITQQLYGYAAADSGALTELENHGTFYDWVKNEVTEDNGPKEIFIEYNYANNVSGNAHVMGLTPTNTSTGAKTMVNCVIEKLPDKHIVWDPVNNAVLAQDQWKITASASVGSGRNAAQYSICNYIYDEIPSEHTDGITPPQNIADWDLMNELTLLPGVPVLVPGNPIEEGRTGSISNAVYTMSPVVGATANNMLCLGPQITGITTFPAGRGRYDAYDAIQNRNDMVSVGQATIVGNVNQKTHWEYTFQTAGEGAVIYGNYTGENPSVFRSTINPEPVNYKELAYFYVDGVLTPAHFNLDGDQPVNLYCGAIQKSPNQIQFKESANPFSDIYLYDPEEDSEIQLTNGVTNLYSFAYNNIKKQDVSTKNKIGGDVISNNKSLTIRGNGVIDGDVVMANPLGTLTIENTITIKGAVICNGTYNVPAGSAVTVANGVAARNGDLSATVTAANSIGISEQKTAEEILNGYSCPGYDNEVNNNNYKEALQGDLGADADDYNYGLFPYGSRLDEIFECYIRWDLAEATEAAAKAHIDSDSLILESRSAGHAWGVKQKVSDAGAVYVPYTTPRNKDANAFIKELVTQRSSECIPNCITSLAALNAKYGATPDITTLQQVPSVKIVSHMADGDPNDHTVDLDNAYVIRQSGTLDLSRTEFQNRNNETVTVFVDPFQMEHRPLVLVLKGTVQNSIVDIVVNNTALYTGNGPEIYQNPDAFYDNDNSYYAGRSDVIIFLDNGDPNAEQRDITNKPFNITTTGAYRQMKAKEYNVVSNPYYPGQPGYTNLPDHEKFRFEMVPNIVVYGNAGVTYWAQNGIGMSAEVLMPQSNFHSPSGEASSKAACTYREFHDSTPYNYTKGVANCNGVGTLCLNQFRGENIPMSIYVGDLYRVSIPYTEDVQDTYKFDFDSAEQRVQDQIGNSIGNFGNDHQGAN